MVYASFDVSTEKKAAVFAVVDAHGAVGDVAARAKSAAACVSMACCVCVCVCVCVALRLAFVMTTKKSGAGAIFLAGI